MIGAHWPEPSSSGASGRLIEWLRLFRQAGWPTTYASAAERGEHAADLALLGAEEAVIALNSSSFDDFVTTLQPDLVLFDRFISEEQFGWRVERCCPDAMRIIETIDLHCLRAARQAAFKRTPGVIRDVADADLYNDTALREIAAILRSDLSVIISDYEMALLQIRFNIDPSLLQLCPFMLEPTGTDTQPAFEARSDFAWIGNFRHPPNWDAVRWLKAEIWPAIRKQLPDARLHIYGAYTPPAASAMHDPKSGFLIEGRAESVETVMRQARINLAPLRYGAGIKTKLADAMRCGTPSITTSVGAEGMGDNAVPWAGAIADDAKTIADAAVSLYAERERWMVARESGFGIVADLFDGTTNRRRLTARIMELQANLARHRADNFTGAMLRHHHLRSTEFMGHWIETKTQLAEIATDPGSE